MTNVDQFPHRLKYLPIAGTHGWRDGWWRDDGSPFAQMMLSRGWYPIRFRDGRPYRWSTDLNGWKFWRTERHADWEAGADSLAYFLDGVDYEDRNLIAHSHGGQVVLLCAASGVPIRNLFTVGTPVRGDIDAVKAKHYIGTWVHLYDRRCDKIQLAGQIGDNRFDRGRLFRIPGVANIGLADISHSKVLRDPRYIAYWHDQGWLQQLAADPAPPAFV